MASRKLPKKLSDGILHALRDLAAVEKSKDYLVNMGVWHLGRSSTSSTSCEVCFAGSVIAKTYKVDIDLEIEDLDYSFDYETANKLRALDLIRMGDLFSAVNTWYDGRVPVISTMNSPLLEEPMLVHYIHVPSYHVDSKKFKKAMHKIARELAKLGL